MVLAPESLLKTLSQMTLRLAQSVSPEILLDATTREIRQLLQVDRVIVCRFGRNWSSTVVAESVETGCTSLLGKTFDAPPWDFSGITTQPQDVERAIANFNSSGLLEYYSDLLPQFQAKASLIVPILGRLEHSEETMENTAIGQSRREERQLASQPEPQGSSPDFWGLLGIQQCASPRQWQELDHQVLQYMASQLAIGLHKLDLTRQLYDSQTAHKRATQELRSRQRELLTLHRISEITLHTQSLEVAFHDILEEICAATEFPIAAIEMYDAIRQVMVFSGAKGIPMPPNIDVLTVPVEQTLSGTVAMTAKPIVKIYQSNEAKKCEANTILGQLGIKTFICLPMLVNEHVVGVLSLAHPEVIQADEPFLQWMSSLASFVASLTERKQTEARLREQAEREQLVRAIAHRIRQSLDLKEILHRAVTEVQHLLQTERVIIFRFEPDWSGVVLTESVAEGWSSILGMQILDSCFAETQIQEYQSGQIQFTENVDTAEFSQCYQDLLDQLQVKAKLVVPILQGEQVWGLLIAHHCSSARLWQTWEAELLKQLADQLAIAIQQSELYQRLHHFNAALEQQVKARTTELQVAFEREATLKRITDKVRDSLDENQILQTVVQELTNGLGVEACNTALFDLERGTSTVCYEYTITLAPDQGRISRMADFPELYDQLLRKQHFQFCSLLPNPVRGYVAMLACPISDDQGVLGDLWLINQSNYAFSEQDIRLVQQVANQCAIALRQSRLFESAKAQVRELERLNRLKDDFLSTVSHELRTPMSSIKMAIQMLGFTLFNDEHGKARDANNPESLILHPALFKKATQYFRILDSECQREITLINDLLDLARLDTEGQPAVMAQVALATQIAQIVEPFKKRMQEQNQQFNLDIPTQMPSVHTDASALERILTELLHNACKYTPANETISLVVQVLELTVLISVSNSGVEIPEGERDRIFDKFYRIPNNDPWKYGGTGLGLALVKKLVERLQGRIWVESQANQTKFRVELPLPPMSQMMD
jgi:GAF domain-containing protein